MIGSHIIKLESVDSTNKKARELLGREKLPEGSIILAKGQFAGRGYANNKWESATGLNITLSLILYPIFLEPAHQFILTQVISLGMRDVVNSEINAKLPVYIKWPNDIYAGPDKIAGILIENSIMGESIKDSICGIGLNVNQEVFISDAPNPVSMKMISKMHYDLDNLLQVMIFHINKWYSLLIEGNRDPIESEYRKSLYRLGEEALFESNGQVFPGIIMGTDEYGRLIISVTGKEIQFFDFKEVAFVR